jgi:hypothetical protein
MTATTRDVFERYVAELERRRVTYVMLPSYEEFPNRFTSDVDHAALAADLPNVPASQAEVAEQ